MFFGAPRLAVPLLIVIALAAIIARFAYPSLAGGFLLVGCLGVLGENVLFTARRSRR
jgi:hypothetical protein